MNKTIIRLSFALVFVVPFFVSCHKKEEHVINTDKVIEVCQRVEEVTSVAESICLECETYDEMYARMDEIASMDGVSNVYGNNDVIYVDIDGWGTIGYSYRSSDGDILNSSSLKKQLGQLTQVRSSELSGINSTRKACIMNAQYQEREWTHPIVDQTEKMFKSCGIPCQVVNYPNPYFYRNEIFNYDLVFIIGHGAYNEEKNLHWLETAEYFVPKKLTDNTTELPLMFSFPKDEIMGFFDRYSMVTGKLFGVYQYYISNKFIANSSNRFQEEGEAVLFMVPCQSLKGNTTTDDNKDVDTNLADAFFEKGAGMYIGYDESSCANAQKGGMLFYGQLLSGVSFSSAISNFPSDFLSHHHDSNGGYDVALHVLTDNGFQENSFLTSPSFLSFDSESDKNYYILKGASFYCPPGNMHLEYKPRQTEDISYRFLNIDRVQYGFLISKTKDRKDGTRFIATPSWKHDVAQDSYLMSFKLDIPIKSLEQDTQYYAWPYLANGNEINYGDMFDFTTKRINRVIPEDILDQMDDYIPIHDGVNPPNIEGQYLVSPMVLVHSTHGYEPGDLFADTYVQFYNQDMENNTLDYQDEEVSYSYNIGKGAFISGEGNDFSVFFNTTGTSYHEKYNVDFKMALVISGTKSSNGIKDLTYAFVMVDKSDDSEGYTVPIGTFRVFKDQDGLSVPTNHFKSPSSAPMKSLPYNPSVLPSMIEAVQVKR